MKRSKLVALMMVCVMSFAVVQPAFAGGSEEITSASRNVGMFGAILGGTIGFLIGGPAGAWAGFQLGGVTGAVGGGVAGAMSDSYMTDEQRKEERETIEKLGDAQDALEALEYFNQK